MLGVLGPLGGIRGVMGVFGGWQECSTQVRRV